MRACRRALIAAGGRPLMTRDLLRWAYPQIQCFACWHYKSIYRAAPRYAVKVNRAWLPRRDMTQHGSINARELAITQAHRGYQIRCSVGPAYPS